MVNLELNSRYSAEIKTKMTFRSRGLSVQPSVIAIEAVHGWFFTYRKLPYAFRRRGLLPVLYMGFLHSFVHLHSHSL